MALARRARNHFQNIKTKTLQCTSPGLLQVGACQSGLGAVLFQDGHPVAMASKALNQSQTNYAVIEKEMLAICFGCQHFYEYVYGRHITIETDHKPLIAITEKPIHKLSAHMQRMRFRLQNYHTSPYAAELPYLTDPC